MAEKPSHPAHPSQQPIPDEPARPAQQPTPPPGVLPHPAQPIADDDSDTGLPPTAAQLPQPARPGNLPTDDHAILEALNSIDVQMRLSQGGNPGTGLYSLLELVAVQFTGMQRNVNFLPVPAAKKSAAKK